jgi:hypothetical protein
MVPVRLMRPIVVVLTVTAIAVTAACGSDGSGTEQGSGATTGGDESSGAGAPSPCRPEGEEKPSKALLRCGEHSIAFIETLYATGSGVAVRVDEEDYILTNLHVVDPFDSADVTLGGVTDLGRLPVVGADAAADIALLGPVEDGGERLQPVPLDDPAVEKGDDVFLVGFPGTASVEDADLTITSGLVSRTRRSEEWDHTYLQSDAVIGEGQSGGPLFADTGDLVGISGLAYDPAFALALTVQDVEAAVRRIVDGDGDDLIRVPQDEADGEAGGSVEGRISFEDDIESPVLFLPPADAPRTWNLTVTGPQGRYLVQAADGISGEALAVNAAGMELMKELVESASDRAGVAPDTLLDGPIQDVPPAVAAREVSPGVFSIELAAGQSAELSFGVSEDAVPGEITWTSDLPLWSLTEEVPVTTLIVGEPAEGVVGGYRVGIGFDVELEEGDEVRIAASSPQGDLAVAVAEPGRTLTSYDIELGPDDDRVELFDDSGEGLYGADVLEPYTARTTGTHRVWVTSGEVTPVAYRVSVTRT